MASDFIRISDIAIVVHNITGVVFKPHDGGDVAVYCVDDSEQPFTRFDGDAAHAFRTWWETKASVNVLYTEPDDGSPT